MKLLEKEPLVAPQARPVAAPRPVARPNLEVRARVVSRPAHRRNAALETWLNRTVAFAAIVGVTYVGSTLAGYVMLERTHQSVRRAEARADFARSEAKEARASIEALTSPAVLRAWASGHGFVPTKALDPLPTRTHGETLVARR